jgi:hypothetical protein
MTGSPRSSFKVSDEREGWLRIFDGYRDGWADKADFVLERDAPTTRSSVSTPNTL